jgi:hypothetical protein
VSLGSVCSSACPNACAMFQRTKQRLMFVHYGLSSGGLLLEHVHALAGTLQLNLQLLVLLLKLIKSLRKLGLSAEVCKLRVVMRAWVDFETTYKETAALCDREDKQVVRTRDLLMGVCGGWLSALRGVAMVSSDRGLVEVRSLPSVMALMHPIRWACMYAGSLVIDLSRNQRAQTRDKLIMSESAFGTYWMAVIRCVPLVDVKHTRLTNYQSNRCLDNSS